MSRFFNGQSNPITDWATTPGFATVATPCSVACWGYINYSTPGTYIGARNTNVNHGLQFAWHANQTDLVLIDSNNVVVFQDSTFSLAQNRWMLAVGISDDASHARMYYGDAGSIQKKSTGSAGGGISTAPDGYIIGCASQATNQPHPGQPNSVGDGTFDQNCFGALRHLAIWNVGLTDGDVAMLAAGALPNTVKPANLVSWWPLSGSPQGYEPDLIIPAHSVVSATSSSSAGIHGTSPFPDAPWMAAPRTLRPEWLSQPSGGVLYPQLERGIRGLHRGVAVGAYH